MYFPLKMELHLFWGGGGYRRFSVQAYNMELRLINLYKLCRVCGGKVVSKCGYVNEKKLQ